MKMMKLALLGGAALALTTAAARADDLSALKAEIEALNARVAQLEAAPAAPAGYSLMTVSKAERTPVPGLDSGDNEALKGMSDTVRTIGVLPTADAAPTTTIEWSGYVYAIVAWSDYDYAGGEDYLNVLGRMQLRVDARTDTSVGEVGVSVTLRSNWYGVDGDNSGGTSDNEYGHVYAHRYWGWWAMTPELTLGGGYQGSLGNIGHGVDGYCNCWWTDTFSREYRNPRTVDVNAIGALNPGDTTQVRLTYASGPLSFAIALEEGDSGTAFGAGDNAVAGEIAYAGDAFSAEISGIWYEQQDFAGSNDDGWQVGAGVTFGLAEMATVSLAAGVGEQALIGDYFNVSGLVSFNTSDTTHLEVGVTYGEQDTAVSPGDGSDAELIAVLAGFYWDPVSQLTLGIEGEWGDSDSFNDEWTTFDVVAIWKF